MNVYVESNFVLELAFLQEQHASCDRIIDLCEAGHISLILPAFCLAEPFETIARNQKRRRKVKEGIDIEFSQIARTSTYVDRLSDFRSLTEILINISDEEARRLDITSSRLIASADVIPLDKSVMSASDYSRRIHGLSRQDALVYSSIVAHLTISKPPQSCFLNRTKISTMTTLFRNFDSTVAHSFRALMTGTDLSAVRSSPRSFSIPYLCPRASGRCPILILSARMLLTRPPHSAMFAT